MQTPNVFADMATPRSAAKGGASERDHPTHGENFDQAQERARALSGQGLMTAAEGMKLPQGLTPGNGQVPDEALTAEALALAVDGDGSLEALAQDLGISEEKLQQLLDQMRDAPVSFIAVADFEQLLDDLDIELEVDPEQAQTLIASNQGQVLQQSVTAQLAQDYLSSGGGRAGRADGTLNLQAVNALAASAGSDGEPDSQTRQAGGRGGESAESAPGRALTSETNVLLQQSNGSLRMGDVREPTGMLRQYTTSVETPVNQQEDWSEQMAGKMAWLAGKGLQSAEIHLNPPDMGPVEVRVSVQNDQAQVMVQAQQSSVRDLLEQNSQRLRDMLEEQGLDLASFDVSDQGADTASGFAGDDRGREGRPDSSMTALEAGETVATGEAHVTWTDGIDLYA